MIGQLGAPKKPNRDDYNPLERARERGPRRTKKKRRYEQKNGHCATPQLSVMYHDCTGFHQLIVNVPTTSPPPCCCSRAWPGGWGCNPHMSLPHFDLWLIPNCNRVNNRLFSGLITGCSLSLTFPLSPSLLLPLSTFPCFFTHCNYALPCSVVAAVAAPGQCCVLQQQHLVYLQLSL